MEGISVQEIKQLSSEQRENLSIFKMHKIKKPQEYGGWSAFVYLTILIPIIGFIFGLIGVANKNEVTKVQGQAMLLASICLMLFYAFK